MLHETFKREIVSIRGEDLTIEIEVGFRITTYGCGPTWHDPGDPPEIDIFTCNYVESGMPCQILDSEYEKILEDIASGDYDFGYEDY